MTIRYTSVHYTPPLPRDIKGFTLSASLLCVLRISESGTADVDRLAKVAWSISDDRLPRVRKGGPDKRDPLARNDGVYRSTEYVCSTVRILLCRFTPVEFLYQTEEEEAKYGVCLAQRGHNYQI